MNDLLKKATSNDENPTPGYIYTELAKITFSDAAQAEKMADFLGSKVQKNEPAVKWKALNVIRMVAKSGRPEFRRHVQKFAPAIKECLQFRGPPDPLRGDEPYRRVRDTAKDALEAIYDTSAPVMTSSMASVANASQSMGGMGSSSSIPPPYGSSSSIPPPYPSAYPSASSIPPPYPSASSIPPPYGSTSSSGSRFGSVTGGGYPTTTPSVTSVTESGSGGPPMVGFGNYDPKKDLSKTEKALASVTASFSKVTDTVGTAMKTAGITDKMKGAYAAASGVAQTVGTSVVSLANRDGNKRMSLTLNSYDAAGSYSGPSFPGDQQPSNGYGGGFNAPSGFSFANNRGPTPFGGAAIPGAFPSYQPAAAPGVEEPAPASNAADTHITSHTHVRGLPGGGWGSSTSGSSGTFGNAGNSFGSGRSYNSGAGPVEAAPAAGSFNGGHAAPAATGRVGGAASDGAYERSLVEELTNPGGVRPVPDKDKLTGFLAASRTLDVSRVGSVLSERLRLGLATGPSGQEGPVPGAATIALKACAVIEAVCSSAHAAACESLKAHLFDNCEALLDLVDANPDTLKPALRVGAAKALVALGVGYAAAEELVRSSGSTGPSAGTNAAANYTPASLAVRAAVPSTGAGAVPVPAAAPAASNHGLDDLLGLGAPAPAPASAVPAFDTSSGFAGLLGGASAPAPASSSSGLFGGLNTSSAPTPAPAPSTSQLNDIFGDLSLSSAPAASAAATTPQKLPPMMGSNSAAISSIMAGASPAQGGPPSLPSLGGMNPQVSMLQQQLMTLQQQITQVSMSMASPAAAANPQTQTMLMQQLMMLQQQQQRVMAQMAAASSGMGMGGGFGLGMGAGGAIGMGMGGGMMGGAMAGGLNTLLVDRSTGTVASPVAPKTAAPQPKQPDSFDFLSAEFGK